MYGLLASFRRIRLICQRRYERYHQVLNFQAMSIDFERRSALPMPSNRLTGTDKR